MVDKSLRFGTFKIDLDSPGHFFEYERVRVGAVVSRPGTYIYTNTGPDTGLLTLTYDNGRYRGGCSLQLTFAFETTGTLHYTCDSGPGLEGEETWRVAEIGAPSPPLVVPRSGSDTKLVVSFSHFFRESDTKAYDFQIRTKSPRGSWIDLCSVFTNSGSEGMARVSLEITGLEPGTVYEVRFRSRTSSRCGGGSPRNWSEIGEGATSG